MSKGTRMSPVPPYHAQDADKALTVDGENGRIIGLEEILRTSRTI